MNNKLSFTLSGNMVTNPAQVKVTGVNYINADAKFSTNDIQLLSYNYNNVVSPPVAMGSITNIKVTRSVSTTYQLTSLNIQLTIQNTISNNEYLLIQLATETASKDTSNPIGIKRYSDSQFNTLLRTGSVTASYSATTNWV